MVPQSGGANGGQHSQLGGEDELMLRSLLKLGRHNSFLMSILWKKTCKSDIFTPFHAHRNSSNIVTSS